MPDPGQRLELYKRLSAIETDDELREAMEEISDRYGPLPGEVVLLGEIMGVKAIARRMDVVSLEISSTRIAVAVMPDNPLLQALITVGFRKLPDNRFGIAPKPPGGPVAARQILLDALTRGT